ncbi:hypothetical protein [Dyella sedimenti]|uniref:hypothetical protein n=1 Tax=Dyella sedimenti TaxID=2919947 RepID=UPI001FA9CD50|nr:hypothetical protein [Dyella sedimenti]
MTSNDIHLVGHLVLPATLHPVAGDEPMSKLHRRDLEQVQLNRLMVQLPRLLQEFPDPADLLSAFAGLADLIFDAAGPDDHDWITCQINAMLEARGILVR